MVASVWHGYHLEAQAWVSHKGTEEDWGRPLPLVHDSEEAAQQLGRQRSREELAHTRH